MQYELYFELKNGSHLKYKIYTDYPTYRRDLGILIDARKHQEQIEVDLMKSASR